MSPSSQVSGENAEELPTLPPWREFFDIHACSAPVSLHDTTTRLDKNWTHFHLNYLNIIGCIFEITLAFMLIPRAIPFNLSFVAMHAPILCFVLYVRCRSPRLIKVFGFSFVYDRGFILGLFLVTTVLPFVVARAWIHLLAYVLSSAAIVGLHGVFRVPAFEYYAQSQPLLELGEEV